ncbi:MAG: hypothetical protein OYH76_00435 [Defluviicoccus sp.]|nr:hypothetical protein [Defluviicoccus sp.]MDE0274330.1 hypothetical protein [Defluviicoccus sp.]
MTDQNDLERKSSRESEIDYLLAEEFECDPAFAAGFASACGLRFETLNVVSAVVEPPLGGNGFADLLVEAELDGRRAALLIEDKITAGPAVRQAERYREHAERMRDEGYDFVRTVLVAPGAYRGERDGYDASIDLEQVAELLSSPDPRRLKYRREIIARAVKKQQSTGVKSPDHALHALHSDFLNWATDRCAAEERPYEFPPLREAYAHNESWIWKIRHPEFPENVWIRYRLWESRVENTTGLVDLVICPAPEAMREQVHYSASIAFGDEAIVEGYGKFGIRVSLRVSRMTQSTGFRDDAAEHAFTALDRLAEWYLKLER